MSLHLSRRTIYNPPSSRLGTTWQWPILSATERAVDTYEQISTLDATRGDNHIISRHLGVFAVLTRSRLDAWQDRVRGVVLFGSQEGLNEDENLSLMIAKALHRAVLSESSRRAITTDTTPAYIGLGKAQKTFSTGIAGPYPFHSRLTHDTFHDSLRKIRIGLQPERQVLDEVMSAKVIDGFRGGLDGDAGDNTPELELDRQQFMEFADTIALN